MTARQVGRGVIVLAADTLRGALVSRVGLLLLAFSALAIALGLSLRVEPSPPLTLAEGVAEPARDSLSIGGLLRVGMFRDARSEAEFLRALIAKIAAGSAGVLVLLVATAGILPEAIRGDAAWLYLVRPLPRSAFLLGKMLGAWLFAMVHIALFFGGTWLTIARALGDADPRFLLAGASLFFQFTIAYSASVLLAICTRSATACALGSSVFWLLCVLAGGAIRPEHGRLASWASWILPRPTDLVRAVDRMLGAEAHFRSVGLLAGNTGAVSSPLWVAMSVSALIATVLVLIALHEFRDAEV